MRKKFSYFFKKHSLEEYKNKKLPSIFFSLWDYGPLKCHKSFALIIWRGSEILKLGKKLSNFKKMKNVYHVAISSYIAKDLDKYGIEYKFVPIVGLNMNYFKPCPLGKEIYTYIPSSFPAKYYPRYGMKVVQQIQKKCKYKINIIDSPNKIKRKKMIDVYQKCFCGLRLTRHDGLPNQVIEMGLMGRKSFYNGNIPGSIKWNKNNIDKILINIEKEAGKIGTVNNTYSEEIKNFITINDNIWLNTNFWEK